LGQRPDLTTFDHEIEALAKKAKLVGVHGGGRAAFCLTVIRTA